MNNTHDLPIGLFTAASGRDLITTKEFASSINKASQTIRKNYCLTGQAFGLRPIKIGNRLLWRVTEVAKLINGGFHG